MLRRREFLALSASPALMFGQRGATRQTKPNIVFIMADDLGVGDVSCYGEKQYATPNIDRIAREGIKFSQAYAGCTVCAPSRSVLMTGYHAGHTAIRSNPGGASIAAEDVTVAELLKSAGYATGGFGKWGLGDKGTPGVPWKQGFDQFFGYLNQVHAHWYYTPFLYDNDQRFPLQGNDEGKRTTYSHDVIAGKALDFIRAHKDQPFFCYMPFTVPHVEWLVPEDSLSQYRGKYPEVAYVDPTKHYADQPELRAAYAGMVTRMDRDIGRVLSLLDELGLTDNTLVFFTSDNGGALPARNEMFFNTNAGLRGHKGTMYEGGLRVPMVARWPGKIPKGAVSDYAWMFEDILPTFAEIAGVSAPKGIDGHSVLPSLMGRKQPPHEYLYWELPTFNKQGISNDERPLAALRSGDWKLVRPKSNAPVELYNLKSDPYEKTDVAAQHPDIVQRLEKLMISCHQPPRPQPDPPQDFRRSS